MSEINKENMLESTEDSVVENAADAANDNAAENAADNTIDSAADAAADSEPADAGKISESCDSSQDSDNCESSDAPESLDADSKEDSAAEAIPAEENADTESEATPEDKNSKKKKSKKDKPKREKMSKKKKGKIAIIIIAVIASLTYIVVKNFGETILNAYVNHVVMSVLSPVEVTDEYFEMKVPENTDQSEAIAKMPKYDADDTWAFYIYIVGSNLESCGYDELSELSRMLVAKENEQYAAESSDERLSRIENFAEEVNENGSDLPKCLYNPIAVTAPSAEEQPEEEVDPDQQGAASFNIKSLLEAENFSDNVKVVMQTGGAKRWQNVLVNPNRSQRFLVDKKGMREIYNEPLVNMGKTETLVDFLKYCESNYKADHEVLILWNHGGGVTGYGSDEIYGQKGLSVLDMKEAFKTVYGEPDLNNPKLEAIGFDACLMASAEVTDCLAGYSKYYYGSEEVEPGDGWDYGAIMEALYDDPSMNGAMLGKVIADSFLRQNTESSAQYGIVPVLTFSVIDLSKAPEVFDRYADFASAVLKNIIKDSSELAEISRAAAMSPAYATDFADYFNTIDLGVFMEELPEQYKAEGDAVLAAIDDAVLYSRNSVVHEGSKGLSVFFPRSAKSMYALNMMLEYIDGLCRSDDVAALYYYKIAGCLNEEYKGYVESQGYGSAEPVDYSVLNKVFDAKTECSGDGNFTIELTPEMMAVAQDAVFSIAKYDAESGDIEYYGDDAYASISEDGYVNTFYNGKWFTYGGKVLPVEIVSETSENVIYKANITYNFLPSYMLFTYSAQEDSVELLGINLQYDGIMPDKSTPRMPKPGDTIGIMREAGNMNSLAKKTSDDIVIVGKNTKLEEKTLEDGTYYEYVKVIDLRYDTYESHPVSFTVKDGKITDQHVDENVITYDKD